MEECMNTHEWSATDIAKARSYFLAGASLKNIASELKRSPTAINKALSRFGIRPISVEKGSKRKALRKRECPHYITAPSFEQRALQDEFDNWVSFWKMCNYLEKQKIRFYEVSEFGIQLENRRFRVDAKILSARQLLIMTNKLRAENNLKAFFVRGLSW